MAKIITRELLEDAYENLNEHEDWYKTNLEIINRFITLYPENTDVVIVATKVALIDLTNSTHFSQQQKKVWLMRFAQNIIDCHFDERIKKLDTDLVREMSKGLGTNDTEWGRNFLSLSSKYCHYHNRLLDGIEDENRYEYPIYDSNVCKNIPKYIDGVTRSHVKHLADNGNYEEFNKIIETILDKNGITKEMMPNRKVALDCYLYNRNDDNN